MSNQKIIKKKQIARYKEELENLNNPKKQKAIADNKKAEQDKYSSGNYADAVARANALNKSKTNQSSAETSNSGSSLVNVDASSLLSKSEEQEFNMLMNDSPIEHKSKTVQLLNKLFDNDPTSKDCIVMIQNKSDCNMIVRIEGVGNIKYRLAIPSKDEKSVVILKGSYLFTSVVCGAQYASQKTVQGAIMVSLDNPGK